MKKLLLSLLFLATITSNAQGLQITNLNATSVEGGINVNLHTVSGNGAGYLSDSYEILGNTIIVKVCYWFNNTLPVLEFEDNIMIPLDAAGDYTVTVNIFNSSSTEVCDDFLMSDSESIVVTYLSTAVFGQEEKNMRLFPNPTNGNIEFSNTMNVHTITVYDTMGRLVKEFRNLTTNKINLEGLSDGIYALLLEGEQETHTQKIVLRQ